MASKRRTWLTISIMALVLVVFTCPSLSQESVSGKKLPQLWEDFIHYIKIARSDLAKSYCLAILDSGAEPREIYRLAIKTQRYELLLSRGRRLKDMEEVISRLRKVIGEGFRAEAANPKEISRSIKMLGGTLTQFHEGVRRLELSGEYALPQLLQVLNSDTSSKEIRERIVTMLPELGRDAVRGLSAALQCDNPKMQEAIVKALGRIGYSHCVPRLKELSADKGTLPGVKQSADAALVACAGQKALKQTTSQLFYELAIKYYNGAASMLPDENYDTANVWYWRKGLGLTFKPVPRQIFCDVYAIKMSRHALKHNRKFGKAISLWIAANFRKERNLPSGATDPTVKPGTPNTEFYAVAAGPRFLLSVLERGLKDGDTTIALGAITALAGTGGAESLVQEISGGIKPLIKALICPNRLVRFLAAVSLADALPQKRFESSHIVTRVLNEALSQKGKKTALIIVDGSRTNELKNAVRAAGFEIIHARNIAKAMAEGRNASSIDVIVTTSRPNPYESILTLRKDLIYRSVPIVVVFQNADLRGLAKSDKRIVLLPFNADTPAIGKAVDKAVKLGIGKPLTSEQAEQWIIRSARTIRRLALTGNKVYDLSRTLKPLGEVIKNASPQAKVSAAQALAAIKTPRGQQLIAQLACSEEEENVRLKAMAALSESLRRFGNLLTKKEIKAVLNVVKESDSEELRFAAAKASGAMNLSSEQIESLILER